MEPLNIFTIGFTKKTAEEFFTKLRHSGASRIIDIRLNNVSQLAGFAKKNDLIFFLREINGMGYVHMPELAPTKEILDAFKKNKGDWQVYEEQFLELMAQRAIEHTIDKTILDSSCLLCSENEPHQCHRRLVVEYLNQKWGGIIQVQHLM